MQYSNNTANNLNDKLILSSLRQFATEQHFKSWQYTLSTLLLLIILFWGTTQGNIYSRAICSLFVAFVFVRMFVIYHDYLHHAILSRSRLARKIFFLFGLFTLAPFSIWTHTHDYHHKHNSKLIPGDGPYPLMTKSQYLASNKMKRFFYLAARHPLNILLSYFTIFLFGMCLQPFLKNPKRHFDCFIALLIHGLLAYLLITTGGLSSLALTLLIPYMSAFAFGSYLFYAQHNFPDVEIINKAEWNHIRAALASSSYMKMSGFMHWVTGNIGYHHIHHLNCAIPFYRLPEAMKFIPALQTNKITSLHWEDIIACLKLKLWDNEQCRMISLKEINN